MNEIIILAGGKGTRMKSEKPKVLTELHGKTFIERVVEAARVINPKPVVIVGYKGEEVIAALGDSCRYVWQREQLGTGHAVQCAKSELEKNTAAKNIIVVPGDHPLINSEALIRLLESHEASGRTITFTTLQVPHFEQEYAGFYAYGRIIRNEIGAVANIVELKDCDDAQKRITETNSSYYCFNAQWLWSHIELLQNNNKASEFYLTDLIHIAFKEGELLNTLTLNDVRLGMGINTLEELRVAEQFV